MEPQSAEAVRAAIAQTTELGSWYLRFPSADAGAVVLPAILVGLVGALVLLAADSRPFVKAWRVWSASLGLVGVAVFVLWSVYVQPLDAALVAPAKVVMQADAYLWGEQLTDGPPSAAQLMDARWRVGSALTDADRLLKRLCLAGGQMCPDGKQSLATAQLMLALGR